MKNTTSFTAEQIQSAKSVSIVGYLDHQAVTPVKEVGSELLYFSPLREEKTPSFYVNRSKNSFCDFGADQELRGDIIRLVQKHRGCSFPDAIGFLLASNFPTSASFSFCGQVFPERANNLEVIEVRELAHPALVRYLERRGIPLLIGRKYLHEVWYQNNDKVFFAIGFQNDSGGFELRNPANFKGKTRNDITLMDKGTKTICMFEGFFDFLSALVYFGKDEPSLTTVVLNTTANLQRAISNLLPGTAVNCFLDNDSSGIKTVNKLLEYGFTVNNYSIILYPNSKDFNEYICVSHR